ncbi:MAG: ribosome recycling factor [Parvicellaceae bacterium]
MLEEIDMILEEAQDGMNKAISHLNLELGKIRAGRANPSMLDSVKVDYYGSLTPLSQIGNVSTLDSRTLTIQPWEKAMLDEITKAIINANLGLNPQNNGEVILISVPVLTEERRKELVKRAKSEGEHAKVSIRSQRKDANDMIKSLKDEGLSEDQIKDSEAEIQKITDSFTKKVDEFVGLKETDIMKV